jgi:transcriptional regulator with XRE-family HTH domain
MTMKMSRITMKIPRKSTGSSSGLREADVRAGVAIRSQWCDTSYAGTREGLILVSKTPPNTTGNGSQDAAATDGGRRRAELADFLRNRREAIKPEDVGLPGGGRRRTPGLRREEVAQLAGVGTTWYTWLEQGRDVRASRSVLESLGDALRLTPAERSHVLMLGRGEELSNGETPAETLSDTQRHLVENLGSSPAMIIGRRWDYLAWNRALALVLGDPMQLPEHRRNHIWATFMVPARRKLFTDWEEGARTAVARFRADGARHVGDPEFEELIDELCDESADFRRWWRRHEVARSGEGRKVLRHPVAGKLVFEHAVYRLEEHLDRRLVLYTPTPLADTPAKLERLLAR